MNAKFVITVGAQHCKSGELDEQRCVMGLAAACKALIDLCGGVSTSEGYGSWADDSGNVVSEKTVTVTTYGGVDAQPQVRGIAAKLRDDLDQHCVLFSVEHVNAELL